MTQNDSKWSPVKTFSLTAYDELSLTLQCLWINHVQTKVLLICLFCVLQLKTTTKKSLNCKTCACLPFQAYEIASAGLADGREAMWPTISHLAFALTVGTQPPVVVAVQPQDFDGQPAVRAVQLWKKLANLDSCLSSKKALRRWKLHCRESRMSISLTSTPELSSRSPSWSSILLIGASTFSRRTKNELKYSSHKATHTYERLCENYLWRDTTYYYTKKRYLDLNFINFIFCLPNLTSIHSIIASSHFLFRRRNNSIWLVFGLFKTSQTFGKLYSIRNYLYCWQG